MDLLNSITPGSEGRTPHFQIHTHVSEAPACLLQGLLAPRGPTGNPPPSLPSSLLGPHLSRAQQEVGHQPTEQAIAPSYMGGQPPAVGALAEAASTSLERPFGQTPPESVIHREGELLHSPAPWHVHQSRGGSGQDDVTGGGEQARRLLLGLHSQAARQQPQTG